MGFLAQFCCLAVTAVGLAAFPAKAQAAPSNDHFANAAVLTGNTARVTGSNVGATAEPAEPSHAGLDPSRSVWWRWTAPADGAYTVETCDSGFDTLLAVYTGTDLGSLSPVESDDDGCDLQSSVTFPAASGQVYWIAVGSLDDEGTIRLSVQRTLSVNARRIVRGGKIDATRFTVEIAAGDDEEAPQLTLTSGRKRVKVDLFLDNEIEDDDLNPTSFRYTFEWLCSRSGRWRWTLISTRGGEKVTSEGAFAVPACRRQLWFVSRAKVAADFARDFGRDAALRCTPAGRTRGSLAHTWRCGLVQRGAVCTGTLRFRYSRVFQGRDVVRRDRQASGRATCRR